MKTLKRIVLLGMAVCAIALLNNRPVEVKAQDGGVDLAALEDAMKAALYRSRPYAEELVGREVDPHDLAVVSLSKGWRYSLDEGLVRCKTEPYQPPVAAEPPLGAGAAMTGSSTLCCYPSDEYWKLLTSYAPFRRVVSYQGYGGAWGWFNTPSSADMCGVDQSPEVAHIYLGIKNYAARPDPGPGGHWVDDFEGGIYSDYSHSKRWYLRHSWHEWYAVEDPPDSGNWHWESQQNVFEDDGWPTGGIAPGTDVALMLRVILDDWIQYGACIAGGGCRITTFLDADGMERTAALQRMRRVHSLIVSPLPPACACGWGNNCPEDPDNPGSYISYGYAKGTYVSYMTLYKWENNGWSEYSWTPSRTKTDWPMDDPDQRAACSDNCASGDFCPDYVYANEVHQYYEEDVSLQAYCNPDRYPQQCSESSCVKCYKFCADCPWPYSGQTQKCFCGVDPQTGECVQSDCSCGSP